MTPTTATIECDALPDDHEIVAVCGVEAMNALPRWTVSFVTADAQVDLEHLLGANAIVRLADAEEKSARPISLIVSDATYDGETRDGHRYVLSLSARASLLTLRSGYRMFTDKSAQEVVAEVLRDAGFEDDRLIWRLASRYYKR